MVKTVVFAQDADLQRKRGHSMGFDGRRTASDNHKIKCAWRGAVSRLNEKTQKTRTNGIQLYDKNINKRIGISGISDHEEQTKVLKNGDRSVAF